MSFFKLKIFFFFLSLFLVFQFLFFFLSLFINFQGNSLQMAAVVLHCTWFLFSLSLFQFLCLTLFLFHFSWLFALNLTSRTSPRKFKIYTTLYNQYSFLAFVCLFRCNAISVTSKKQEKEESSLNSTALSLSLCLSFPLIYFPLCRPKPPFPFPLPLLLVLLLFALPLPGIRRNVLSVICILAFSTKEDSSRSDTPT